MRILGDKVENSRKSTSLRGNMLEMFLTDLPTPCGDDGDDGSDGNNVQRVQSCFEMQLEIQLAQISKVSGDEEPKYCFFVEIFLNLRAAQLPRAEVSKRTWRKKNAKTYPW